MDSMADERCDVLIVGAGPTGLALALALCRAGHVPRLVERLPAGPTTSRAAVIHAHTLEVLGSLGVAPALVEAGLALGGFSLREHEHVRLQLSFRDLPTSHPYLLMLPQDVTERLLTAALLAAGGVVRRGEVVEALAVNEGGVCATIATDHGMQRVQARYVVGADGMHSTVRAAAGIAFEGSAEPETFILGDVEMAWAPGREEVMLFMAAAGPLLVAPLPGNRYRVVAAVSAAHETPGVADIEAVLSARGPRGPAPRIEAVYWSSRFRLHHRLAANYRSGPFVLVGDAAHVHSPAGGQGMNTGLVDACVLGAMLAQVLDGQADDAFLDRYGELRRPAAQEVLALAARLTRIAMFRDMLPRLLRNALLAGFAASPAARHRLAMGLSGLSRRERAVVPPLAGT